MEQEALNRYEESKIKNKYLPSEWQDQRSLDELAEFLQYNWEQRAIFFDDGEISSNQQYLGFIGQKGLRTNNYIGTIAFKGKQLNIFPKVFRDDVDDHDTDNLSLNHMIKNLVQWLKYCNSINYPFISISGALKESTDLRELFITLYVHYVEQALKRGPFYRYEEKTETLKYIKGHINFKDYINNKMPNGQSNAFLCSYSDYEFDNIINRIIKYTCKSLTNTTTSKENERVIRQILIRLNDVSDTICIPSDCDGIRLSKFHKNYSVLLSMSKMFLLNQTTAYNIDSHESFCFLFPTQILFEGFISGFISETLAENAKVKLQASDQTLIDNIHYDGQDLGKAFTMRHDILVEHKTQGVFILDTKYKHMPRFKNNDDVKGSITEYVKQADLYQVVEYASHRDLSKAYLLYPMYRHEDDEPSEVILERISQSGVKIDIHIVRLPFIFEDDIKLIKDNLAKAINRIFS